jgi:glycosyltransferase involved in cell wall biosynthesis
VSAIRPPDRPLVVVHVLHALRRSGAEQMLVGASDAFKEVGIEPQVLALAPAETSERADEFERAGWRVTHRDERGAVREAWAVHRYLRVARADVVHVHREANSLLVSLAARCAGAEVVRTVHAGYPFVGWLATRKRGERALARRAGIRFVAVSRAVADNEMLRFANPTLVIENWIDGRRFRPPSPTQRSAARRDLGLDVDRQVVAVVGNCDPVKRHDMLFRALARVPTASRPLLLHAGSGATTRAEEALVERLGLVDHVRFLGGIDDVGTLLHASDRFALPSEREGLPVSALEALACGVPVLAADVPGCRELVGIGPAVTLVPDGVDAWAGALGHPARAAGSGPDERAADAVAQRFGIGSGVAAYVAVYRMQDSRSRPRRHRRDRRDRP